MLSIPATFPCHDEWRLTRAKLERKQAEVHPGRFEVIVDEDLPDDAVIAVLNEAAAALAGDWDNAPRFRRVPPPRFTGPLDTCPDWCVEPADHDVTDLDIDGSILRSHRLADIKVDMCTVIAEHGVRLCPDGERWSGGSVISLRAGCNCSGALLEVDDARKLVAALTQALAAVEAAASAETSDRVLEGAR